MEFNANKPIYLQLAEQVMDNIESGTVRAEERMPSVREYAAENGVNANTVMRTYTWLQQEGMIYNKRGIGYFYSPEAREKVHGMRRKQFYDADIPYFIERMKALGITIEEFTRIFNTENTDIK